MGKSTETLWLLTNEQKAFWDNLRKSGLGYNGPYVLSQAYAKIPKLYRAYELCDKNKQLHVFDSEDTLEEAEKSRLKMNEFQNDEKVQELKIKPIDYEKLNKLYDDFVPQKELSVEQTYFSSSFISSEKVSSKTKPSMASMPSANPMLVDLNEMENVFKKLFTLLVKNSQRTSIFYTSQEELRLIGICVEAKLILQELHLSRVETNHCDEVKVEVNFDEIETKNIELEYQVASLVKENEHLKLTYQSLFDSIRKSRVQTKTSNVTQNEAENLKSQLFEFAETKFFTFSEKLIFQNEVIGYSELKGIGEKHILFENETSVFK
ncbi:hypothetical protein Tco_0038985 [Tanacetum coccineum]